MIRDVIRFFEDVILLEKYTSIRSIIHEFDPRLKMISIFAIVITAVLIGREIKAIALLFLIVLVLATISNISIKHFLFRATIFVPIFAAIIVIPTMFITPDTPLMKIYWPLPLTITDEGLRRAIIFTSKVWICVASLILLVMTTPFWKIVQALGGIGMPKIFTMMLAMVYRYLFLFAEEIYRMALAREARTVRKESCGQVLRSMGRVTGNIFIRSYEKGEQVYRAMLARGYTGEVRYVEEFKCQLRDWFLLMIILYLCGLTIFIEVV